VKSRKLAAGLALLGVVTLPGLHRFYLGQPRWGLLYLLMAWKFPVSRIASGIEALWYLFLEDDEFDRAFNGFNGTGEGFVTAPGIDSEAKTLKRKAVPGLDPAKVEQVANAVREIENLRQEGLMTEMEFEQKRRKLLDQLD
jgi:TM2 domain-containing membrane protein YozV